MRFPDFPYNADNTLCAQGETMKTIPASVASKEFGRYLDTAQRESLIVTKQNRRVAVTMSFQEWEKLTKLCIELGLRQGLSDLKNGRFEDMSDASTAARLAVFKDRSNCIA